MAGYVSLEMVFCVTEVCGVGKFISEFLFKAALCEGGRGEYRSFVMSVSV